MWHRRYLGSTEEWHGDLVRSSLVLADAGVALVVVDPLTGQVLSATAAIEDLLGSTFPERAADLVERGLVARPDLDAIVAHLDAWRTLDDLEGGGRESSHAWSTRLRVHGPAGPVEVALDLLHHRRPGIGAEAVLATVRAGGDTTVAVATSAGIADRYWLAYDHQMRIIAADPRLAQLGIDPASQVGLLGAITVHPEDVPSIVPLVTGVINERLEVAHYVVRIRSTDGWVRVQCELRRLMAPDGPVMIGALQAVPESRRTIPLDALTDREADVVRALFDGLRVASIADRHGVAVKTVRNQLASTYRKLDVAGQEELLSRFTRPAG